MENNKPTKKQKLDNSPSEDNERREKLPIFLQKTFEIFSNPEYEETCSFSPNGDTIVIKKVPEFCSILPLHFKHENFQSFVRQLNMYDFHKTAQDPTSHEWQHSYFRKGRQDLLPLIKRKVNDSRNRQPTSKTNLIAADYDSVDSKLIDQSDLILRELVELRQWRLSVQTKLDTLMTENQKMVVENDLLWQSLQQHAVTQRNMQTKMQKILFFMYDMYLSSNGQHKQLEKCEGSLGGMLGLGSLGGLEVGGSFEGVGGGGDAQLKGKGFTNLKDADFFEKLKLLGMESPVPGLDQNSGPAASILKSMPSQSPQPSFPGITQSAKTSMDTSQIDPSGEGILATVEGSGLSRGKEEPSQQQQPNMSFNEFSAVVSATLGTPATNRPPSNSSSSTNSLSAENMRALGDSEKQTRERIANIEDSLSKLFQADDFSQLLLQNSTFPPVLEDQVFQQLTNAQQQRRTQQMEGSSRLPMVPPHQSIVGGLSERDLDLLGMMGGSNARGAALPGLGMGVQALGGAGQQQQQQQQQRQENQIKAEADILKMFGDPSLKPPG